MPYDRRGHCCSHTQVRAETRGSPGQFGRIAKRGRAFLRRHAVQSLEIFAAVIQQLPAGCCIDICVFYLVLRALDTVEDDMTFYAGQESKKEQELRAFASTRLLNDGMEPIRAAARAMREYCSKFWRRGARLCLTVEDVADVIQDVTQKMGGGMADYVTAELAQGTQDTAAYNLYCHNVAGLRGRGLTGIFVGRE